MGPGSVSGCPNCLTSWSPLADLMRIDEEYRLQTEEGAEWEKDYRSRLAAIRDDATRLSTLRSERLAAAVEAALGGMKLTHGSSKTPRKIGPVLGTGRAVS